MIPTLVSPLNSARSNHAACMKKRKKHPGHKRESAAERFVAHPLGDIPEPPEIDDGHRSAKEKKNDASDEALERIDAELTEIYRNSDGTLPNMREFVRGGRFRLVRAVLTLLLSCAVLGAVVYAGLFVFQSSGSFAEELITVSVVGDEAIVPGTETRYRIRYRNGGETALKNVIIEARYPEGFLFTQSSVESVSDQGDRWELGELAAGDSGFIDVFGTHFGSLGKEESVRIFFHYTPETFSSNFQKVATHRIRTAELPYSLSIEGPDEVVLGTEVPFVVRLDVGEAAVLDVLAIEIDPGSSFRLVNATPKADQFHPNRWSLDGLEKKEVSMTGLFTKPDDDGPIQLPIRLVGWSDSTKTGEEFVYETVVYQPTVLDHAIQVTPVVNGATKTLSVQPGETLNTSIALRNSGQSTIRNVQLRAFFDTPSVDNTSLLDWAELVDENNGTVVGEQLSANRRRGVITWTSRTIPALRTVAPGQSVTVDLTMPLKDREDADLTAFPGDPIEFVAEIQYEQESGPEILSSQALTMTVNSDLALDVRDDLDSDAFEEDTHTIYWVLTNSFHDLEHITLSADVYGETEFVTSSIPAGELHYDADTQKLLWTIPQMPVSVDVLPLQFVLRRSEPNPSQTQLVSKVELRATDTVTGEQIIIVGDEITL